MVQVLRLETFDGDGIYVSGVARSVCNALGDTDDSYSSYAYDMAHRHPEPHRDSKLSRELVEAGYKYGSVPFCPRIPKDFQFGFSSYGQFRSWFFSDEFLAKCAEDHNIVLRVYEVETMVDGSSQCVYDPDGAEVVMECSPTISQEDFIETVMNT